MITDSQLTSSTAKSGDPSSKGRFSLANSGWCPTIADTNPWLQIDFGQPMVVTAIATQGHAMSGRTYKYNLKYKKTTSSSLEYAKNKLNGNMVIYFLVYTGLRRKMYPLFEISYIITYGTNL